VYVVNRQVNRQMHVVNIPAKVVHVVNIPAKVVHVVNIVMPGRCML
jgi:hypothetical protein